MSDPAIPATDTSVSSAYDRWAETYDTDANRTRDLAERVLRDSGVTLAGRDVLEIGAGSGRNTEWLAEQCRTLVALDASAGMLERARARVSSHRVRFQQHDLREPWPLPDASVDAVIDTLVLEHIEQLEPIFSEAARVLRPGGEIFICELHPMRQLNGGQAQFTSGETGEMVKIPAFLHDVSGYVNTALDAGFNLLRLGEWRDADAPGNSLPRVLSAHFRRRETPAASSAGRTIE